MTGNRLPSFGPSEGNSKGDWPDYIVTCNNGYRSWYLAYDEKSLDEPDLPEQHQLQSLVMAYDWQPGLNRASCLINASIRERRNIRGIPPCEYPSKACVCGFYAYYDVDKWTSHSDRHSKYPRIEGIIEGFGHCVVGSKGFRAQSAVIVGLLVPDASQISTLWLGSRSPEAGRELLVDILRAKFPLVPLYDRLNDMLMNTPLMGKPQVAFDLEGDT